MQTTSYSWFVERERRGGKVAGEGRLSIAEIGPHTHTDMHVDKAFHH